MIVAVTAQGPDMTSEVDPRFGRAKYFVLIDTKTDQSSGHNNVQNLQAAQGAGIQAGRNVIDMGAQAVITDNVGPKAFATLEAGKVRTYIGASGTVAQALERFKAGLLERADSANVEGHWT